MFMLLYPLWLAKYTYSASIVKYINVTIICICYYSVGSWLSNYLYVACSPFYT